MELDKKHIVYLTGIHSSAWEHPADRLALKALQSVPHLDTVLKAVFGSTTEKSLRLLTLASSVRVTPRQFSRLHAFHLEACRVLDVDVPELFVANNPFLNAGAVGLDRPFIVLNSAVVERLDDSEIMDIIGHEIGHIKSGHVLYKTLLAVLLQASTFLLNIPLTGLALMGVIAALKEWDRKSELSADRAGLLVAQNPDVSTRLLMKMAGGTNIDEMNLGEFIQQAKEYNSADSLTDNLHKLLNLLQQTHPFPVIRVLELINWVSSGEYENILRGDYKFKDKSFYEDAKEAANAYKEGFKQTTKPLEDVGEQFDRAKEKAKDIFDQFKKRFDKNE